MILTKFDRYIIRKYLTSFIFTICIFTAISVVIDITEKVESFMDNKIPFQQIVVNYYFNFIPYINALLFPLFTFISVIFFTSKMAYKSEFIAILSSGVSFYRILYPYFIASTILFGTLWYLNNYSVPKANKGRLNFENHHVRKYVHDSYRNIHIQYKEGEYLTLEHFSGSDSSGFKLNLIKIGPNKQITYKLNAKKIQWDTEKKIWHVYNYQERFFDQLNEHFQKGEHKEIPLEFKPTDLKQDEEHKDILTRPELNMLIEKERMSGSEHIDYFLLEKHRRQAAPFSIYILVLIAVSIASRKVRGGTGLHIAAGIAICSLFVLLQQFSMTFTTNGSLPAWLGIWVPNIIFGFFSLILLKKSPK